MSNELVSAINKSVPAARAQLLAPIESGDSSILVAPESILEVAKFLLTYSAAPFRVLEVISGVDYPEYIEVVYVLATFDPNNSQEILLKTRLTDKANAALESVTSVWLSADWQERECYDMLGVTFKNHPDPRRILCPDDWEGHPLRKDYAVQKYYRGMEVNPLAKSNPEDRMFGEKQKLSEAEILKQALAKGM